MLKQHEWDSVLDNIQSGSTIVCLGAEIFAQADKSLDQQLLQQLAGLENVHVYADGLFHFRGSADMTSFTKIKQFYNRDFPGLNPLLEKLAALRVPVFINASPDLQLRRTFERLGRPHQYGIHYKNKPAADLAAPTASEPLVYNFLGDIEHRESVVLTHGDLFEFLESLMEGKSISRLIRERINAAYNFIFIGLPFGKWYMKVLLHFLQKGANDKALKFAANEAFDNDVQAFVVDQFQITCVPVHIAAFVDELYQRCADAGLLRTVESTPQLSTYQRWTKMVQNDELSDLLSEMITYFSKNRPEDVDSQNQLLLLSGRLTNLKSTINKGIVSTADASLQRNQIRDSLIQFMHETVRPIDL